MGRGVQKVLGAVHMDSSPAEWWEFRSEEVHHYGSRGIHKRGAVVQIHQYSCRGVQKKRDAVQSTSTVVGEFKREEMLYNPPVQM
jgi:hypothetical protein